MRSPSFDVRYTEGSDVGYRWYAATHAVPLFSFGYGLGYSAFAYANLTLGQGSASVPATASFDVTNTGRRAGTDIPQLYLLAEPGRTQQRLLGWSRQTLAPGQTAHVTITIDPRLLANWDEAAHGWHIPAGQYRLAVSMDADSPRLQASLALGDRRLRP